MSQPQTLNNKLTGGMTTRETLSSFNDVTFFTSAMKVFRHYAIWITPPKEVWSRPDNVMITTCDTS